MNTNVSVIGTGRMGSALARAFAKRGHPTSVWNRTRSRAEPLAAQGIHIARDPAAAVREAQLIVVNLIDYEASQRVLEDSAVSEALRGKLLLQLSSGSPEQARRMAAWALERGIDYLDGAIMATPDFIGDDACTLLYSGSRAAFERQQATLGALGGRSSYLGSNVGLASALDSALLALLWGNMFAALLGAAICEAEGYPLADYLGHAQAIAPVIEGAIVDLVQRVDTKDHAGERSLATLEAHAVGLRHLLAVCQEHQLRDTLPAAFHGILQDALQAGHASDDFAVLTRFMRR